MTKHIDHVAGALLLLGALLHCYGSLTGYPAGSEILVWALSGSLASGLVAVLNLVRAGRPQDRPLAWISFVASLCWATLALAFGAAIGSIIDPRVMWHVIAALVLAGFSLRTAMGRAGL